MGEHDVRAKHILGGHNQDADHLANLGTEGKSKSTIGGVNQEHGDGENSSWPVGRWKKTETAGVASRSKPLTGSKWITLSKIVVSLKVRSAMATEIAGVSVLT